MKKIGSKVLLLTLTCLPLIAKAQLAHWQIVTPESEVTFTATQNNAPISGKMKSIQGVIDFDPAQLMMSKADIVVDMNSISMSYGELANTLKMQDWLNVKLFPQANFKAENFSKSENGMYKITGKLTIRDKTVPVSAEVDFQSPTAAKGLAKGSFSFKRTDFGIGQGEWASTDEIKNEVKVNFIFSLAPAKT